MKTYICNIFLFFLSFSSCITPQTQQEVKSNKATTTTENEEPTLIHVTNFVIDTSKSLKELDLILSHSADTDYLVRNNFDWDSVAPEDIFINNLLLCLKSPKTFGYQFPILTDSVDTRKIGFLWSDDNLLRVFNWLSPTTGSWQNYWAVFQAKNKRNKIVSSFKNRSICEGYIAATQYGKIYRLNSSKKQLYLCIGGGQYSSRAPFDIVETIEVNNDSILPASILQGDTTCSITIFTEAEYEGPLQNIPDIDFDTKTQTLTVPEMTKEIDPSDEKISTWTGKLIKMKFNGDKFVKIK